MKKDLERLLKITKGCREDMHEPDEQGVKAKVIGDHLDNAFGDSIRIDAIIDGYQEFVVIHGYQEFVVILNREGHIEKFNLATLIALARKADINA